MRRGPKPRTDVTACIVCGKPLDCGSCRGLCYAHYSKYSNLVKRGGYTWGMLIDRGKALPRLNDERLKASAAEMEELDRRVTDTNGGS